MNMAKIRVCEFTILEKNTTLTEIRQTYYNNQLESSYDEDYEEEDDYWDDESEDNEDDY